ncbi:response regulator transcription factor [Brevibacillus sp. SYP-B805]|uniref:LytR/AlgR family response regulator transcription factor n=1 Tax=Brevibacillus sp. SYP-B805 TaxID=1578199 RepID=UPI0013EA81D1|nr:LytTR family DNA-binding domain-containing protein [Brevibacillus sp. SYP-B805]NGQ96856.1 response regulator transcription factor [Brevibacillus sp. SYP-B805]
MLKVFLVDDEMPARAELRYLLEQFPDITVIGEAASGEEALEQIPEAEPDAVFLDIHLHDRDGVDVGQEILETMGNPPMVIFASAYDMYAVRAFETEAVDYIVKPFSLHRLEKTVCRIRKWQGQRAADANPRSELEERIASLLQTVLTERGPRRIPGEKNGKILLIDPEDIVFATVEGRNAVIHTETEQYATSFTLQELESRLPEQQFCRTHRAFIVNLNKAAELVPWFKGAVHLVMQDQQKTEIPVSRNAVKEVKRRLGF